MSTTAAFRLTVVLLWTLAAVNALTCRGLFWDGASFLASALENDTFHDFYPARAHVAWLTQSPVLLLVRLGVSDTHLLAIVFSAMLIGVPVALYHLALARVRERGPLLAAVLAIVATVYLPTSFFVIGEYQVTYAAVTAAVAVALTSGGAGRRDGAYLLALGLLTIASYEAMIYLGPLAAVVTLWSAGAQRDRVARLLFAAAAIAFLGGAVVSISTVIDYWNHDYFTRVRAATWDFWQNLQFVVALAGLAMIAIVAAVFPGWLASRGPIIAAAIAGVVLLLTPWLRQLVGPQAMLFPPAHYVARTAAGGLLVVLLLAMWAHSAWLQARWKPMAILRQPVVARRLTTAMVVLLVAGAVPDLALTRLWVDYLAWFRGVVTSRTGLVYADTLPLRDWPYRIFAQDWTYPALSALVRGAPGQAIVVARKTERINPPFDPSCGTVPRLEGFAWR